MRSSLPCAIVTLLAACSGDSRDTARHIPGGKEVRFHGVTFDLPANWRSETRDGAMVLMPEGANANGMVEELYVLGGDPNVRSLEGDAAEQSIQQTIAQLQPGSAKKSGPIAAKFGALDGRTWTFTARAQDDKDVEMRVFGFVGDHGCALIALAYPELLAKRAADLDAMLASFAKAEPAAAVGAGGGVAAELAGQWIWMSNFAATNGGGSQNNTWITLQGDGRYQWHHDSVSTNPNGAAWGSQDETGTWSLAAERITFRPDRGNPYTQTLEKRNHPKNVNDPMIVLDGAPYVTATNRRPW